MKDGEQFTAFVPVPPVMASMMGNEDDREAVKETERSGGVGGSRRGRTRTEVETVANDILARSDSFAAAEVRLVRGR